MLVLIHSPILNLCQQIFFWGGLAIFSFYLIYLVNFSIVSKSLCRIFKLSFQKKEIVL